MKARSVPKRRKDFIPRDGNKKKQKERERKREYKDGKKRVCPRSDWKRIEVSISFQFQIKARLNADTLRDREWISRRGKLRQGEKET